MEESLGLRIKGIRKTKKMTLKELAEKTDLSISFLSQLERGKSLATLNSLKKISLALQVNPAIFFEDETNETAATALDKRISQDIQFVYEDLSKNMENPVFQPMHITLKPGDNEGEPFSHSGQEFLYVLKGILTVQIGERVKTLMPHQSIMFDANEQHYWYNYSDEDVQFICVTYDQ